MNISNFRLNLIIFIVYVSTVIISACDTNREKVVKIPSQPKVVKNTIIPKPLILDTIKVDSTSTSTVKSIASDSISSDTSKNTFHDISRKLDSKYFKKSFSLHKKAYVSYTNSLSTKNNS